MNNLDRLIKAEGVQGGVLAEYENRFRRFADVKLASGDDCENLKEIADAMHASAVFCHGENFPTDCPQARLWLLALKARTSHLIYKRY